MEELRDSGKYLLQSGKTGIVAVEIGVDIGSNAITLLENLDISMLHLVDPFTAYSDTGSIEDGYTMDQEQLDADYIAMQANMAPYAGKINIVKEASPAAASLYQDEFFDYVYIDGCQCFDCVTKDIAAWWPKVKVGGVFAGHDFYSYPGVKDAVENFIAQTGLQLRSEGIDWYVIKL